MGQPDPGSGAETREALAPIVGDEDEGGLPGGGGPLGAGANGGGTDDELTLPKATVYKLIQEMLPPGISCPKETRDLLIDCCVEFIHLLSSEANDVCEKNSRKTIAPEHVIEALRNLGFDSYIEEVNQAYEETVSQAKEKERVRGSNKLEQSGLTEEQLQKQQEELFERARQKYLANVGGAGGDAALPAMTTSNDNGSVGSSSNND